VAVAAWLDVAVARIGRTESELTARIAKAGRRIARASDSSAGTAARTGLSPLDVSHDEGHLDDSGTEGSNTETAIQGPYRAKSAKDPAWWRSWRVRDDLVSNPSESDDGGSVDRRCQGFRAERATVTIGRMSARSRDLPRRSCLSTPASSERFLAKAPTAAADMTFLDLEDA